MKYFIFLTSLMLGITTMQSQSFICGDEALTSIAKAADKQFDQKQRTLQLQLKNYIDSHYKVNGQMRPPTTPTVYYIPVVFHVIHNSGDAYGTGTNLSYLQLQSQIDALNAAFNLNYPAYNGQTHPVYAEPADVRFCLARIPAPTTNSFYAGPLGTEYGVMRYSNTSVSNHNFNANGANALLGLTHPTATHFPFTDYLNIWVVSNIGGGSGITMGYGTPPGYPYPLNGIVMRYDVVGDNSTGSTFPLGYGLTQGKVLVHEAGHYLTLRHIFEGGCAGANPAGSLTDACDLNGDMICDIEPCLTQNITCTQPIPNTCSANYQTGTTNMDMIESYMSYADDDCMNTFTNDQVQRMWACLNTSRSNLWSQGNLGATGVSGPNGCNPAILFTNIGVSGSNCINAVITVSNPTSGNTASSWTWTAPGGTVTNGNTAQATVTFSNAGLHQVNLAVSDGTTTIIDSVSVSVANCSLDPNKLNRNTWMLGDYCSISFATGQPVPNNTAIANNTIKCFENAVSMSDSSGNLLFYSNGRDLWNANHVQVNTSNLFGWDLIVPSPNGYNGTSVSGFMSFPVPKQPGKYFIVCTPPLEIKGFQNMAQFAKIDYVIYDAVSGTVSPFQQLQDPNINYVSGWPAYGLTENLCVVPHCNGVDYWIIARGLNPGGSSSYFYSFLVNQNGLDPYTVPVMSGPYSPSLTAPASDLKSNSSGSKLVAKAFNKNRSYMYDFDASTGMVTNPLLLATSNSASAQAGASGIIFSPNDQYIYTILSTGLIDMIDVSSNTVVKTITPAFGFVQSSSYMEIGPDNNIYVSANNSNNSLGQISNPNSVQNSTLSTYVGFTQLPGCNPRMSLLNFMEAVKPAETHPMLSEALSCSAWSFSLHPCWKAYTAAWNFGDGSAQVTGTNVTHTYASPGIYTVSIIPLYYSTAVQPYTQTINVTSPQNVTISGPNAICLGSTFLNSYNVTPVTNATYSWSAANATIAGPDNFDNINAAGGQPGVATLSVLVNYGGCTIVATKTVNVVNLQVGLSAPAQTVCTGHGLTLSASPSGGSFTGPVSGSVFNTSTPGNYTVTYSYTDPNGCFKTATLSVQVLSCGTVTTDIHQIDGSLGGVNLYPNPVNDMLFIQAPVAVKYVVTDPLGRVVLKGNYENGISTAALSEGIYFIALEDENKRKVELKFVKENR